MAYVPIVEIRALAVLPHIPSDGTWIMGGDLAQKAGVPRNGLSAAIRKIKEWGPQLPLVRKGAYYQFTMDLESVDNYRSSELSKALTLVSLVLTGTLEPWLNNTDYPFAEQVIVNIRRIVEDLSRVTAYRMDRIAGMGHDDT